MKTIKLSNIINNNYKLSPSNYCLNFVISLKFHELNKFIEKVDKGMEIGSENYIDKSIYHFIRTSAFNDQTFLLNLDNNSYLNITPNNYVDYDLKKGDILICKDSNVGEVAILDEDIPNSMISSGINRIYFKQNSLYFFAMMKNKYFKSQLEMLIPKGATLKHAKDLYLECKVPFTNKEEIQYIESLVQVISNKENEIKRKKGIIEKYIVDEIENNQKNNQFIYKQPSIKEIKKSTRLDTGIYTYEFKNIDFKIKNYKNGYYNLNKLNIKGGNTPKQRFISDCENLKYLWITPSFINDDGSLITSNRIECDKNNINENCMLVINRTSKGGFGEYVGIASFYDYNMFGKAQHNQGIYKIFNYPKSKLLFMTCLLNSNYYRKYCANMSMGSKMKEIKLNNVLQIPFPNFSENSINFVVNNYYNNEKKPELLAKQDNDMILENKNWDDKAGLLDLFYSVCNCKKILQDSIENIYNNQKVDLNKRIF